MRPIASDQCHTDLALNEVFGTKGQVRLLRLLIIETDGAITSPEVAARTGMTTSGARKALRRLVRAGVVKKVGSGTATRYALREEGELADEIVRLFQLERAALDPEWVRGRSGQSEAGGNGLHGNGDHRNAVEGNGAHGNGVHGNGSHLQPSHGTAAEAEPSPTSHSAELDPDSQEFHDGLVALLEENLSLINRARERILEKLEHRHPNNGHDDWEWRKILDTYPLPRLLHFLESNSPRAERLRKSSPFPEVMSKGEKKRLGELVERVH